MSLTSTYVKQSQTVNPVLKNTLNLLIANLASSAVIVTMGVAFGFGLMNPILYLIGVFALYFLVVATRNSAAGIASTFAFTGFISLFMAGAIGKYLSVDGGSIIVAEALGLTAATFIVIKYMVVNKGLRISEGMKKIVFYGFIAVLVLALVNLFILQMGILQVALSCAIFALSTFSLIWRLGDAAEGNDNYILAHASIFIDLVNMLMSLMNILSFSDD